MAGRWRSAQRRKRWTENAAHMPQTSLLSLKPWPALQPLAEQLESFGQQPSTYAQLPRLKNLGNALLASLQLSQKEVRIAIRVVAELLFVENSRPLHRGLLSTLSHVPSCHVLPLLDVFQECCQDYGFGGSKERRFSVVAVSASLASLPQPGVMKEVARHCARSMSNSLSHDVHTVLQHALDGGRPTPSAMEECQDALSSIYYLLQQFPDKFERQKDWPSGSHNSPKLSLSYSGKANGSLDLHESSHFSVAGDTTIQDCASKCAQTSQLEYKNSGSKELQCINSHRIESQEKNSSRDKGDLYGKIVCLLLDVLQTAVLSRDCLVAAGVGLCAAAQLCGSTDGLALLLANTAFSAANTKYGVLSPDQESLGSDEQCGILEAVVVDFRNNTLRAEMDKFSEFGRLCFFRGVLTAIPRNVQNVHLVRTANVSERSEFGVSSDKELRREAWTVLYDGILPALCGFCESSVDSHFKFHAVTAMQICLQQIKTSICGHLTHSTFKDFKQSAIRHGVAVQPYDPLPAATISRVLKLIWNNWEDPLTQTVKQVQVVFDLLVDVQLVHKREIYGSQSGERTSDSSGARLEDDQVGSDSFLRQIACDLLAAGKYRKGKYVPLASLVLRIGAWKMLRMSPDLLFHTIDAFSDDDVCSSASTFLKTFLEKLREDCWSAEGVLKGTVLARRSWIPAVLSGLLTGDHRLRNNLTTYALPVVLQIDSDSLLVLVAYILDGNSQADALAGTSLSWEELKGVRGLPEHLTLEQQVVLLISVLKVARSLALVEGSIEQKLKIADEGNFKSLVEVEDQHIFAKSIIGMSYALFCIKNQVVEVPVSLLLLALTHQEDGLRVDATELMCLNPKTASMPSPLELCLLRIALPLNMRCSSTAFRMRWTSFLKKFFLRVRTAVERQQKAENLVNAHLKRIEPNSLQDHRNSGLHLTGIKKNSSDDEDISLSAVSLEKMLEFMQWLSQMLVSSLYPSAPYERKNMAMEVFNALIEAWSLKQSSEKRSVSCTLSPYVNTVEFSPYHKSLLSVDFTLVVVSAVVDSWDRLREGAYKILIRYPTPLPGLDSESTVERLLMWAKGMVNSPRVRESDAGALAFRLIFRKYVVELGWLVKAHPDPSVALASATCSSTNFKLRLGEVVVQYLDSLNNWLQWGIEEGDKDLLKACAHSFVHGVLLVLRYTVEEIDWTSVGVQTCSENIRAALARLLSLLLKVTSLALWVVSADALNLQEKLGGPSPPGSMFPENDSSEINDIASVIGDVDEDYESDLEGSLAPAEQMVMVGCWLSVKEVSLLLGTIARVVPLPGSPSDSKVEKHAANESSERKQLSDTNESSVMLDGKQLEAIGSHFVQVLLSMKHNGAIDKTRTGFIALCDRLLRSSDPWLNKLPEVWLQQLMEHTGAKGQVVDDLLRRSAGIPPAFLALFLAEPDGAPKKLLPMAMRWLIDTCKRFMTESGSQSQVINNKFNMLCASNGEENNLLIQKELLQPMNLKPDDVVNLGESGARIALKSRDEGVVPTVHAFNVLRMTFHDTNLATDTSGYCAEGLITAIRAFSSSYWEVRNSATLTFTALVHRTIGFLNVYKRESARRAITGFEFFHRYPTLHPFLLQELQSATWQLEHRIYNRPNEESGLANSLHPSLGPVLIILSRLKPSFINSDVEDWLNPSAFMPYVTRCATQQNLHVRVLASRALVPLVSSDDLLGVLLQLAQSLPMVQSSEGSEVASTDLKPSFGYKGVLGGLSLHEVKGLSFNAIHGVLLQMYTLLTSNCVSLPELEMRSKIVTLVFQTVKERLWLGSIRLCSCYMVVGAFLDMLGGLLSLAEACQEKFSDAPSFIGHLQQLLAELSCECLDDSIQDTKFQDPTRVTLHEKAAKVYFETILLQGHTFGNKSGKSQLHVPAAQHYSVSICEKFGPLALRLKQGIINCSYEVRLATLKVLKKYPDLPWIRREQFSEVTHQSEESSTDFSFLRPLIIVRLRTETYPRCIHRILQVIYAWTLIDMVKSRTRADHLGGQLKKVLVQGSVWGSDLSSQELWCCLLNIYKSSKQIKTKEVAVQCLGGCLQQLRVGPLDEIESFSSTFIPGEFRAIDDTQNPATQIDALPSMISSGSDNQHTCRFREIVAIWLGIARLHSAASQPVNFRRATSEAIVACGLLEDANWLGPKLAQNFKDGDVISKSGSSQKLADLEWYGQAVLSAWCMCIKLLEDEDQDLRQKLALSLLNVIASSDLQTYEVVPAQVEKVIQVSFDFLSAQFGLWREYYEFLAEWVFGSNVDTDLTVGDVDLVRRLFDKEIDNHHEEGLLIVQLSCLQIGKIVSGLWNHPLPRDANLFTSREENNEVLPSCSSLSLSDGKTRFQAMSTAPWYRPFLQKWRMRLLERANLCAKITMQIKDRIEWVGGVTNHQDTFKILYSSLLGLLLFAGPRRDVKGVIAPGYSDDERKFVSGMTEVSSLLGQLQLNPLVSNLLVQVLQTYEQQLHVDLCSSEIRSKLGDSLCVNFEPLFLLS